MEEHRISSRRDFRQHAHPASPAGLPPATEQGAPAWAWGLLAACVLLALFAAMGQLDLAAEEELRQQRETNAALAEAQRMQALLEQQDERWRVRVAQAYQDGQLQALRATVATPGGAELAALCTLHQRGAQ